ncbi:hypothetical protein Leryth_016331 [Lithospermum erythrorhizon]|nr:hypothetical protein Leryth_016331 [Lithospermum erythrorhizon]
MKSENIVSPLHFTGYFPCIFFQLKAPEQAGVGCFPLVVRGIDFRVFPSVQCSPSEALLVKDNGARLTESPSVILHESFYIVRRP